MRGRLSWWLEHSTHVSVLFKFEPEGCVVAAVVRLTQTCIMMAVQIYD